jgi:hypothetical protein
MRIDDELVSRSALISRDARIYRITMGHTGDAVGFNDCVAARVFERLVRKSFHGVVHSRHGINSVDVGPLLHLLSRIDRTDRRIGTSMPD